MDATDSIDAIDNQKNEKKLCLGEVTTHVDGAHRVNDTHFGRLLVLYAEAVRISGTGCSKVARTRGGRVIPRGLSSELSAAK